MKVCHSLPALALAFGLSAAVAAPAAGDCAAAPYECAVTHVERHEFAPAIALLEPLVQREPRNLKALNLLGIALTGAGRVTAADARFRQALAIDPAFYPSLKNLAINQFNAGRSAEAEKSFERVLTLAPADEISHLYLGEIQFQRSDLQGAAVHYGKSGRAVRVNPAWTLHYAGALLSRHETAAAAGALAAIPEADADDLFEAGSMLGRAGAYADAARFFGRARSGYRDTYAAGYNQVLMLEKAGDAEGAIRVGEELLGTDLRRGELYNLVSRAYYKAGRVKDAYDALRTATELEPQDEENYVDLSMMCLELENHDLGLEIVDIGLRYLPASPLLHLQRGVLLAMKAQLGAAEGEFEVARRLAPENPAPYAALGMVWMQTGQTDKAVETLRAAARARRNDHVVPYTFAVALIRSGVDPTGPEAVEAIAALQQSIAANGEFAPARSQLGRLFLKRGDLDQAIRELEKAVALDPDATAALYNLAQAYTRKGDRARAADLLARVSKLNAQERGDDPEGELKRTVVRIVREAAPARQTPAP